MAITIIPRGVLEGDSSLVHVAQDGDERLSVLVVDHNRGESRSIGATLAWNYQQGSMAAWVGGLPGYVVYNDISGRTLGCTIVNSAGSSGTATDRRFVPWPIQTLHPSRLQALTLNYRRLWRLRAEYGYVVQVENFTTDMSDDRDGIWMVDLDRGVGDLLLQIDELRHIETTASMKDAHHKVNHIMYSPSGARFVFLHRWIGPTGKHSRLFAGQDGRGAEALRLLMGEQVVSHYCWLDDDRLVVWGRHRGHDGYFLADVTDGSIRTLGCGVLDGHGDGHPSFSPDGRWMITDTYPDKARMRQLLLYDSKTENVTEIGSFFAPWKFDGPLRCDLHPRWSPDGRKISIDSAHEGMRGNYIIDVGKGVEQLAQCRL